MKLFIGNLSYAVTDEELRAAFEPYGEVVSAAVIKDKFTGRSRGFGFVEMGTREQGTEAIAQLDGKDLKGKALRVSESQPRPQGDRPSRPNGGGRGDFGGPRGGGFGGRSGGRSGGFGGPRY